jgi:hypothetical protein
MKLGQIASTVEEVSYCTYLQKGDKIHCSNYKVRSLVNYIQNFISYLLSRLLSYIDKIIADHQVWIWTYQRKY